MEPSLGDSVDDITGIVDDLVEDDVLEPVEPEPNKVLRQEPRRRNDSSRKKQENLRVKRSEKYKQDESTEIREEESCIPNQ